MSLGRCAFSASRTSPPSSSCRPRISAPASTWRWRLWQKWKTRFFGYHRDVPPAAAAQILGGQLVYTEARNGQWVGVIELEQIINARDHGRSSQAAKN